MTVIVCAMLLVICLREHHHKLMRNALCYIITTATIHEVMEIFQLHYKLTGPPLYMSSVIDQNVVTCCLTLFIYYLVVCIGNMHLGAAGNHFLFFTFLLFYSTSLWYFFYSRHRKRVHADK